MAIKNFNATTGAGGCGCTDPTNATICTNAINNWRAYIATHAGDTLTMRSDLGTYNMDFGLLIIDEEVTGGQGLPDSLFIPSCTIAGAVGTTVGFWNRLGHFGPFGPNYINNMPNSLGVNGTQGTGAFIATCHAGDPTVRLLSLAEAAAFIAGRWIAVCGICIQDLGLPPNFQRLEYHQMVSVNTSTGVITLDSPLQRSYSQTWSNTFPTESTPTQGGAACIYRMSSRWDTTTTIQNIRCLNSAGTFATNPLRTVTFEGCTFDDMVPSSSSVQTFTMTNCTFLNSQPEMDKFSEHAIFTGCHMRGLNVQSASPNNMTISSCTIDFGFGNGLGLNTIIENTTIGALGGQINYGTNYGCAETLTFNNVTILNPTFAKFHGPEVGTFGRFTYLGAGLWRMRPIDGADFNVISTTHQSVSPGFQYCFCFASGGSDPSIFPDGGGPPLYFCVTDFYETPNLPAVYPDYMIQTTWTGALPTATFNSGHAWNTWQSIPYNSFKIDGVQQGATLVATNLCTALVDVGVSNTQSNTQRPRIFTR